MTIADTSSKQWEVVGKFEFGRIEMRASDLGRIDNPVKALSGSGTNTERKSCFARGSSRLPNEVCPHSPKSLSLQIQPRTTHPTKEFVNATQDVLSDLHR